jgi:hypothetical protein
MSQVVRIALLVLLCGPVAIRAQSPRPGMLTGQLIGPDSTVVPDATLRATQGARTIIARSGRDGVFRLAGLGDGEWTITVRRLGFAPVLDRVTLPPEGLRRDYIMREAVAALDPVLVSERWTGVRGIVGDIRRLTPLPGARIEVVGDEASTSSDSAGRFALPLAPGTAVLLRVEAEGFLRGMFSLVVPAEGYLDLEIPLDTMRERSRDWMALEDLDRRLRFATPRSAIVGRDEILRSDAARLDLALAESPTLTRRGIIVTRGACVFVDGVPRPGFPVDAVLAGLVEFVEVYPAGTDLSRTLAQRWPPRGICGVPTAIPRGMRSQVAQFVAIWTRKQ